MLQPGLIKIVTSEKKKKMGCSRKVSNLRFALVFFAVILSNDVALADRHVITKRTLFAEPVKAVPGPEKNYTGYRVSNESNMVIYHCEQTMGVVEFGENREMLNCELLEVRTERDKMATLASLKVLIPKQIEISLPDMNHLMQNCQVLDRPKVVSPIGNMVRAARAPNPRQIGNLLRGVFPGTKWCGAGDVAATYYDIGPRVEADKCCRTHDLCPVKIAGLSTQYNLTNYAPYSKSHCDCNTIFYQCLKNVGNDVADLIGYIFFDVLKPLCVEDILDPHTNQVVRREFANRIKPY